MRSTTYLAPTPESLSALLLAPEIGGLRLEPFEPVEVRDQFFDTPVGDLLARGFLLRVREQNRARSASLRWLRPEAGAPDLPDDVRIDGAAANQLVPPGPFAEALRRLVGDEPLTQVLALAQSRTVRVGMDGDRAAALFSFDVVTYETPGAPVTSHEVEVQPLGEPSPAVLGRVHADLVGRGLDPEAASKYERGIVHLPRSLTQAVLLTPAEREALEAAAASDVPLLARRARIVLLDAKGLRPDTIAAQTGLSMARVRHWRLRFRKHRLGILELDEHGVSAPPAELPVAPAPAPVPDPAPPSDAAPEAAPEAGDGPEVEAAPASEAEAPASAVGGSSGGVGGDGLAQPENDLAESRDMADLLDLFTPAETDTPLLGDDPDEETDERFDAPRDGLGEDPVGGAPAPPATGGGAPVLEAPTRPPRPAGPRGAAPSRAAFPVVLGPVPARPAPAPEAAPPRRPALSGETPLVEAARATLAYHVASFEAAADRLAARRTMSDVRRLLLAAHRVRLGAEAFRMVLPGAASERLIAGLRPLVVRLDAALDAGRTRDPASGGAAVAGVLAWLDGDDRRLWTARARRLLDRLAAQRDDGVLLGDDLPFPPDDFVGERGDAPVPSRLRHVLASLLWDRYEAVRAFEADLEAGPDVSPQVAYHLAVAVSGLHFALGLAERASSGPVRAVAETLDGVEHLLLQYRGEVLGGEDRGPEPVREAWAALLAPDFRARLAEVAAGV